MMKSVVLTGTKQQIAAAVAGIEGEVRSAVVYVEEPTEVRKPTAPGEDSFAKMRPYMVHVGDADYSRESIYDRDRE